MYLYLWCGCKCSYIYGVDVMYVCYQLFDHYSEEMGDQDISRNVFTDVSIKLIVNKVCVCVWGGGGGGFFF